MTATELLAAVPEAEIERLLSKHGIRPAKPWDAKAHDAHVGRLRKADATRERESRRIAAETEKIERDLAKVRSRREALERKAHALQSERARLNARHDRETREAHRAIDQALDPVIPETDAELVRMIDAHGPSPSTKTGGRDLNGNTITTHHDAASRRERIEYLLKARLDLSKRIRYLPSKEIPAACEALLANVPRLKMEKVR